MLIVLTILKYLLWVLLFLLLLLLFLLFFLLQIGREEGEGGKASERGVLPAFSSHALSGKLSRGKTELLRKDSFLHDF